MAEAELTGLLNSMSGTLGNFVFRNTKNGIVVSNRPRRNASIPTPDQQRATSILATVASLWPTISDSQRAAWNDYANLAFPKDKDGRGAGPSGQAIFFKINWYRNVQGLPILANTPTSPPPSPVTEITVAPSSDSNELDFSITHSNTAPGSKLIIEATRPFISPARNPQPGDYRFAKGLEPESIINLQATGPAFPYNFTPVRFPVDNGLRFGLRLTILNSDGVPSLPTSGVFLKQVI